MSANTFPAQIEPFKWAEQGFSWSGTLPLARFTRLAHEAVGAIEEQWVQVDCKLSIDEYHHIAWLDAHLEVTVTLPCQRCLAGVEINVSTDVHVAILNDEKDIDYVDEDADFIILGEDLGTQKGDYKTPSLVDLVYILEDELLLSMPHIPKHQTCEMQHQPVAQTVVEEKRENPFEILAGLKGKLGS